MKGKILGILREADKEYISGEKISNILGVSRAAVWKHIEALRDEGYEIASATKKGYNLISVPDTLFPQEISAGLDTKRLGKTIYHFHTLDSTNEYARVLAEEGAVEGTVVIAEQQKKGRGRMERSWFSPSGGIWLSVILRPPFQPHRAPGITLVSTVAVTNALAVTTGLDPLIKWPNDIYIEDKKVAGILTEMRGEMDRIHYFVQGIGINANIDHETLKEFPSTAVSLEVLLGHTVDRKVLARSLLEELDKYYLVFLQKGIEPIIDLWKKRNCTLGSGIILRQGNRNFRGTAVDITTAGGLVLRDSEGQERVFYSGDATVIK